MQKHGNGQRREMFFQVLKLSIIRKKLKACKVKGPLFTGGLLLSISFEIYSIIIPILSSK